MNCPTIDVRYKDYTPRGKFVIFEKSGHSPFVEETMESFRKVADFLKR